MEAVPTWRTSGPLGTSARQLLDAAAGRTATAAYHLVTNTDAEEAARDPKGSETWGRSRIRKSSNEDKPMAGSQRGCFDCMEDCVGSWPFQVFMGLAIVANSIVIGMETDIPDYPNWNRIELAFLFVFFVELVVRMAVVGCTGFFDTTGPEFKWNTFDFVIVSLGTVDLLEGFLPAADRAGGTGFASVFRVVRLLRILRLFRIVRFMKPLYMLAYGLILAAEAIMWVTLLMICVLYVCSIILVRTLGSLDEESPHREMLQMAFGSICKSMLSLFNLMVNPYLDPYKGVLGEQPVFTVFILGFVIFGSFGMIALLTGVINESMFEKNSVRLEEERLEREARRKMLVGYCGELFDEIDVDGTGIPSERFHELDKLLPQVADMFKVNGVALVDDDLEGIIDLMDADGSGVIDKDEFCHFFMRIAEGVRPLLLMEMRQEILTYTKVLLNQVTIDWKKSLKVSNASWQQSLSKDLQEVVKQLKDLAATQQSAPQLIEQVVQLEATNRTNLVALAAAQRGATASLAAELRACAELLASKPSQPGPRPTSSPVLRVARAAVDAGIREAHTPVLRSPSRGHSPLPLFAAVSSRVNLAAGARQDNRSPRNPDGGVERGSNRSDVVSPSSNDERVGSPDDGKLAGGVFEIGRLDQAIGGASSSKRPPSRSASSVGGGATSTETGRSTAGTSISSSRPEESQLQHGLL